MHHRFLKVGHKGAAALAPENTIASLAAALEHGVDMVEFDVVARRDGRLVLAHSTTEITPEAPTLDEALAFIRREAQPELAVDLDLKVRGAEEDVVASLRRNDLLERALASSFFADSLQRLRTLEPRLQTGISYPWDRTGLAERRTLRPLVWAGAAALRGALPFRIEGMAKSARATSVMLHFSVLSSVAVKRCHELGLTVFAWTIDELGWLDRVLGFGVDGVISNDPRIFDGRGERSQTGFSDRLA
jgi:glycerophosphoryl diester phosphodiesterase